MCKLFCEGFFREAGKDAYQKIKKATNEILHKPFNPKIEIILAIITFVFLLSTIIFLLLGEFIYSGTLYVTISDINPNYNGTPVYHKNCWISAGLVCLVFFVLFLIEFIFWHPLIYFHLIHHKFMRHSHKTLKSCKELLQTT